jgi:predicted acyl esterase
MAMGWLRASHRATDPELSEPHRPWHRHDRETPMVPGEPTLLEIEIWPTSITLAPGERLRLELLAEDGDMGMMAHTHPGLRRPAGGTTVHVGGEHASHLLLPVIPADPGTG